MAPPSRGPNFLLIVLWIAAIAIVDQFAFASRDSAERLVLVWAMILIPYVIYKLLEARRENREQERT